MSTLPKCLCIIGLTAGSAMGQTATLLDQIGASNGLEVSANGTFANQYFVNPTFTAYDIGVIENFENPLGLQVTEVSVVTGGLADTAYTGIDAISAFQVNFYNSNTSAGVSLVGDVLSQNFSAPFSGDPNWGPTTSSLLSFAPTSGLWTIPTGTVYVSAIPTNDFASNGQTAVPQSNLGDGLCWQANPNGGFAFGAIQQVAANAPFRVIGGSGNACDVPLPTTCTADVSGPDNVPDGLVGVDDILAIIGSFGQTGDGTARPIGDCAPLPSGNCQVDVDDLLACIGQYETDCRPRGACCFGIDGCTENALESDCNSQGGEWLGSLSTCDSCRAGACCLGSGTCLITDPEDCQSQRGSYLGDGVGDCLSCPPLPANNDCVNATQIAGNGGPFLFDNSNATTSASAPITDCGDSPVSEIYQDLWYRITPSINGNLRVSSCNATTLDTVVAVYDSCGGTLLACNDDGEGCTDFTSSLTLLVNSGQTYFVRMGSFVWNETAAFNATIEVVPESPGACCLNNIDCLPGLLGSECDLFGGSFVGEFTDCDTVSCGWPGCQPGDTDEGLGCQGDTDAAGANADANGGTNVDPPAFGSIAVGESICGQASTFLCAGCAADGSDATFRDTDWYRIAGGNPQGGVYTLRGGGQGPLLIGIIDIPNIAFVGNFTTTPLGDGSITVTLPAGDNYAVFVAHDFGAGITVPCGSNLTQYSVTLTAEVAPAAACCVAGVCIGDLIPEDCLTSNGTYIANEACAENYACALPFEGCLAADNGIGEEPLAPNQSWTAGASDATFNYNRYASTSVAAMTGMRIWGLTLAFDSAANGFAACVDPDMTLSVGAYGIDGEGLVGTAFAEASVLPVQQVVDLTYSGVYPLRRFDIELAATGDIRWVKAASESANGLGDCWLLWMSSSVADDGLSTSLFDNGGTTSVELFGLAHCVYQP